jgi:hypothetical protein
MEQPFLLSAAARSLSPGKVMQMPERGAENVRQCYRILAEECRPNLAHQPSLNPPERVS